MAKKAEYQQPDYDFITLGISSTARIYRLAWYLNTNLGIDLEMQEDKSYQVKGQAVSLMNYSFETENCQIILVKNRNQVDSSSQFIYLAPELKQFDYLLIVRGEDKSVFTDLGVESLKQISIIQLVLKIDHSVIKILDNLIF